MLGEHFGLITAILLCLLGGVQRGSWAEGVRGSNFFPEGFSEANFSRYTVRYVSNSGEDAEDCLQSQPYTPPSNQEDCFSEDSLSAVRPCRSLGYTLLEDCNFRLYTECAANVRNNLVILLYPGVYDFGANYSAILSNYTNLVIRRLPLCKSSSDGSVVVSCTKFSELLYNNMYIIYSVNLAIDGIEFSQCGPKSPGAAMLEVHNATITNCDFRNNLNSGFVAYSSFNMTFRNCTFRDNNSTFAYDETESLSPGDYRYAGGLTLVWRNQPDWPVTVLITNCTFVNNAASINTININDINRPNFYVPRGHGGALLVSFNSTNNHTIWIEDTIMVDNVARFNGGGIFVSFYMQSNSNRLIINRTRIEGNICTNAGGGISMNTFEVANFNYLIVENTNFTGNKAWVGGGACTINHQDNRIPSSGNPEQPIDNIGLFKNCIFRGNYSPTGGSTVSMVSNARVDQVSSPTNFTDCQFLHNEGRLDGDGAVMGFRFPYSLMGTNVFRGNKGGGASLLQSQLHAYGHTLFEDNESENGGAIELKDFSLIQLFQGTNMTFINNSAIREDITSAYSASVGVGGAISVRSASEGTDSDIIRLFNTRCFLQYEVETVSAATPPRNWNVTLSFINNTADTDGAAIYATDLERCTFAPSLNVSSKANAFDRSIFKLSIFNFEGNRVRRPRNEHAVATAPSRLLVDPEVRSEVNDSAAFLAVGGSVSCLWDKCHHPMLSPTFNEPAGVSSPQTISGAPGEVLTFTMAAVDQSNNWQSAIWNINEDEVSPPENYFSLREGAQSYYHTVCDGESCSLDTVRTLRFSIVQVIAGSVSNVTEVKVQVRGCYPGYYLDDDSKCSIKNSSQILRPDTRNHYIYIQPQYYAAYNVTDVESEVIVYVIIPIPFQYCKKSENNLAGCLFQYDEPDKQCSEGREGFLCGTCIAGENGTRTGVDLTLIQCVECSLRDTLLVAFIVILFVVGCALVLIFNIGIPNELRGCLFFIQVVGFVYQYRAGDRNATWDFHLSRVFGSSLYLPLCPLPGTNALYTTSYGLLLPTLAIITIIVYIISARFIKHLSNKNSFDGIWFLTFIIYKFVADTCFSILRCQKVSRDDDELHNDFVYYYDGSFKCFTTEDLEHLCFAVVALILGVLVILFPAIILLISFKRYKMTEALTDVLNRDLKISCRWWGSFDLFRRLLFIMVVLIFNYILPLYSQLALLFSGLLVFFTFACTQPYNSLRANIMEGLVQLDLLVLTALFLDTTSQHQDAVRPFGYLLLLIPFVSMVLYISVMLLHYMWNKWCPRGVKRFCYKYKLKIGRRLGLESLVLQEFETHRSHEMSLSMSNMESIDLHTDYSEFREELLDD